MNAFANARVLRALLVAGALYAPAVRVAAQHLLAPPAALEQRLRDGRFNIISWTGSRMPKDRTQRVAMEFTDSVTLVAKWALSPKDGGAVYNNEPRYEVAAYEIQKAFLGDDEYVVPPTVLRVFPLPFMNEQMPNTPATFREAPASALVVVQYWLSSVTPKDFWNAERARADTAYARAIGNFNILTYLIRHGDANVGNYLISADTPQPRVFAVDNGISFGSELSDRGYEWIHLRVDALPRSTVDRLRIIDVDSLHSMLGVLAEYRIVDGALQYVQRGPNFDPGRGVRHSADRIQLGLTKLEINRVHQRLRDLVKRVDEGKIKVF